MPLQMMFQMSLKCGVTQLSSFPQPATRLCSMTEIGQPKTSLILFRKTGTRTRTLQSNPTLERMNYNKGVVLYSSLVHACFFVYACAFLGPYKTWGNTFLWLVYRLTALVWKALVKNISSILRFCSRLN